MNDIQISPVEQKNAPGSFSSGDGVISDAVVLDERRGQIAHQDLALIDATEADEITINRTKSKISPFIEIRKERLVDELTGAPSKAYGIWVPDPYAEGGWKDMGTVSENYLLLTNKEVRELALEIADRSGHTYKESRIFWDGARFAHIIDFNSLEDEIETGDSVGLSLITRTSYDRSWKFESALMGKRFLCDNGVLSGEFFARVSFKHVGDNAGDNWKEVVRQGLAIIERAPENLREFVQGLRRLKNEQMTDQCMRTVWGLFPRIGDAVLGKVMARYVQHEEPTLYGFLNAGTNVFWHSKTMTGADFNNNDYFSSQLLRHVLKN